MTPAYKQLGPPMALSDARSGNRLLIGAGLFMLVAVVGMLLLVFGLESLTGYVERPYMIPWVIGTGIVMSAPLVYLKKRDKFTFAHPIVFPTLVYFIPIFFLGGWSLVFGLSNYYYLSFVNDPEWDFPLAFLYVNLGYLGLVFGFFIPLGKRIGNRVGGWLPKWDLSPVEIVVTSVVFLVGGVYLTILAVELGQLGYQGADAIIGETGSLNFFLTLAAPTSTFLLWIAFFKIKRWGVLRFVILGVEVLTALFGMLVAGSKSSLVLSVLTLIAAMMLVEGKISARRWAIMGSLAFFALLFGVLYGNTFRAIKGSNERIATDRYFEIAVSSVSQLGEDDIGAQLEASFFQLAERLEIASSLAVVVSNYEALATYEQGYGLDNNIWRYTWTALIPRFLWKDKPTIADNYSYNELYFGYGGFGLAITAMGDLLRNFGPVGVPLGMLLLGFLLRIFYASLVEGVPFAAWKATLFFLVIAHINYDSFYGEILPTAIRVGAIVTVQLFLMRLLVVLFRGRVARG